MMIVIKDEDKMKKYIEEVKSRSRWRYLKGFLIRWYNNLKYEMIRKKIRSTGSVVGKYTVLHKKLRGGYNLIVGDHTSIQSPNIDTRSPVKIGDHVVIGQGVKIITTSHNIDSEEWEHKYYGLTIDDYVWIATDAIILPSCRNIGYGAVIAAGSVVVKNVPSMAVVSGNPATIIKMRKCVHSELCVEALLGGDYFAFKNARKSKN